MRHLINTIAYVLVSIACALGVIVWIFVYPIWLAIIKIKEHFKSKNKKL